VSDDLSRLIRKQQLLSGYVNPDSEEETMWLQAEMEKAAKAPPNPQDEYLKSAAMKEAALASKEAALAKKAEQDAELSEAKTKKEQIESLKGLLEIVSAIGNQEMVSLIQGMIAKISADDMGGGMGEGVNLRSQDASGEYNGRGDDAQVGGGGTAGESGTSTPTEEGAGSSAGGEARGQPE
jgi:hypothetical protein